MTLPILRQIACWLLSVGLLATVFVGCGETSSSVKSKGSGTSGSQTSPQNRVEPRRSRIWFSDVTARTGIDFIPRNGEQAGHLSILESLGTGVALLDFDCDGRLDIFFPGGGDFGPGPSARGRPSVIYRNTGELRFVDVAAEAGIRSPHGFTHGCFAADYDNDGFPDVLVTGYGGPQLFHNCGDGTFEDVTNEAGLHDQRWATAAAWADFDGDGNLDLYLAHYVNWSFANHPVCRGFGGARDVCSPNDFDALDDTLYIADGGGRFRDASKDWGLVSGGKGLGVIAGDFDQDGLLDLYVANDTTPNFLYQNEGGGRFVECGILSGAALNPSASADGSMGLELTDFNRDGRPDLWVTNFEHQNFALYRNGGQMVFQHVSARMGITAIGKVYVGFGTVAVDFDNDGDEDLFVSNGHVMLHSRNSPLRQRPLLFENVDGQRFNNVAADAGDYFRQYHRGRGVAAGDLDGDGRPDLVVTHINEPVRILRNESPSAQATLRLSLVGTTTSRDPVGAVATLMRVSPRQVRFAKSGASYLSTSDSKLYWSPQDPARPLHVTVNWPGGQTQRYAVPSAGDYVIIQDNLQPRRLPTTNGSPTIKIRSTRADAAVTNSDDVALP